MNNGKERTGIKRYSSLSTAVQFPSYHAKPYYHDIVDNRSCYVSPRKKTEDTDM